MSEAKEEYDGGCLDYCRAEPYIKELEQQKAELINTLNYISDLSTKDGWIDTIIRPVLEKYK